MDNLTADVATKMYGHAALFNQLSQDLGGFREKIAPGAFANTIKNSDIRALFNHDPNMILGRNTAGTLRLSEDSAGLAIEIDASETQCSKDLMISMSRGDISQMSFAFNTISDVWNKVNDEWVRTLLEVELFDVSPVTYPAYMSTDIALRSMRAVIDKTDVYKNDLLRRKLAMCL